MSRTANPFFVRGPYVRGCLIALELSTQDVVEATGTSKQWVVRVLSLTAPAPARFRAALSSLLAMPEEILFASLEQVDVEASS